MTALKVRAVGNSLGVILPREVTSHLHAKAGDTLFVTETPHGVHITPYDADFEAAMEAFEEFRTQHSNALRELARR